MAQKTLLDIPGEVLSHHLFPNLELNDLLRLRRVCKPMNRLASDYIRLHGKSKSTRRFGVYVGKKTELSDFEKREVLTLMSMECLMKLELKPPSSEFMLFYDSPKQLLNDENTNEFLSKFGNQIEELAVCEMSVPLEADELKFYESFPNLKRLTIGKMDASMLTDSLDKDKSQEMATFPLTFKSLTHLAVHNYVVCQTSGASRNYLLRFLKFCEQLEHYGHPRLGLRIVDNTNMENYRLVQLSTICASLNILAHFLHEKSKRGRQMLKMIDMESLAAGNLMCDTATGLFLPLFILCNKICEEGLQANLLKVELPFLEKLEIKDTKKCSFMLDNQFALEQPVEFGRRTWPKLKALDVNVTSTSARVADGVKTSVLFRLLFDNIKRPTVTELQLWFIEEVERRDLEEHLGGLKSNTKNLPIPSTKMIVTSCFNLTKLTLVAWPGTNNALCALWEGLRNLEEVTLSACTGLGNVAFVGADMDNPIFLQLEKLKKLRLLHLDHMPKITDTAFRLVFRHLKLKEFRLTSSSEEIPLKSITQNGIKELLTGAFAETIEVFPFKGWTLDGATKKEMKDLSKLFRSSFML